MWNYSEKMMEHFKNPRNVGEIENPDAIGEVGNLVCGDALKLTLKIDKNTQKIIDAKFKTFGCASAIATSSAVTEIIKGMTLDEASKVTNQQIADYLGGLPDEKMHCSVMCMEALEKAVAIYRGEPVHNVSAGEKIICKCFEVTDHTILHAIKENNLHTVDEVTHYTKAGGGCGGCRPLIEELIKEYWEKEESKKMRAEKSPKHMTNLEKIEFIKETIDKEIRPMLQADGGNIELHDIDGNTVYVKFLGRCMSCPSSNMTLKGFIEEKLKHHVHEDIVVEEVKE